MKHCGHIASKRVCSDSQFIIYSHTNGLVGGGDHFEEARRLWEAELAKCRERGRESDDLLFQWRHGQWMMCGSLYDTHWPDRAVLICDRD